MEHRRSQRSTWQLSCSISGVTPQNKLDLSLLGCSVAITRFLFRSRLLYDIDSVNFALAIQRFDPHVHQPHPPGYFLYICLGRLLNVLFHDANLALVVLSILSSCGVVLLIYRTALAWFDTRAARFAGGLFLFSPLAWFHGTVALTYSVEAFFSALVGYLCWRVYCGSDAFVIPAGLILGISAGVRPSSLMFLGPLFLFSLWAVTPKRKLIGIAALAMTLVAWFLPMISASGGFAAYFGALFWLWNAVPARDTVFNSSPATSIARACTIVLIYILSFGAASILPLAALRGEPMDRRKKIFTAVWIAPALCFFTFIFLQFVNSGYLLLLSAPACIWLGFWASEWYEKIAWRKSFRWAAIVACATANVLIFLFSPFYCSYTSVRSFEAELKEIRAELPHIAPASDTLIVGFDSHFLGYRHAGYYLPGYVTIEYPEVKMPEGVRMFVMEKRDTRLLSGLQEGSCSRFVLFPLPGDSTSYAAYLQTVKGKLPGQGLRTIRAGGHDFVTGPVSDLPLLFPDVALIPQGVYVSRHSEAAPVNRRAHQPGQ